MLTGGLFCGWLNGYFILLSLGKPLNISVCRLFGSVHFLQQELFIFSSLRYKCNSQCYRYWLGKNFAQWLSIQCTGINLNACLCPPCAPYFQGFIVILSFAWILLCPVFSALTSSHSISCKVLSELRDSHHLICIIRQVLRSLIIANTDIQPIILFSFIL